ncbi:MAG: chemotaxis protein CheX [Pseudobdellovibrio sp.]
MTAVRKIPAQHPFIDPAVILNVSNGVTETLQVMAQITADFQKPFIENNWRAPTDVSVHLTLNSDPYRGRIQFHFNKSIIKQIIKNMLDAEAATDEESMLDCMGEISNMFYGAAKTKLNASGFNLSMTIPKPCLTQNLPKSLQDTTCMVIPFKVDEEICYIEIIIL